MIAIFYRAIKEKIYIFIWNATNGKHTTKVMKLSKVEIKIPHVRNMLQLRLYLEVGKRILLAFKNSLMISTYFFLNEKAIE